MVDAWPNPTQSGEGPVLDGALGFQELEIHPLSGVLIRGLPAHRGEQPEECVGSASGRVAGSAMARTERTALSWAGSPVSATARAAAARTFGLTFSSLPRPHRCFLGHGGGPASSAGKQAKSGSAVTGSSEGPRWLVHWRSPRAPRELSHVTPRR